MAKADITAGGYRWRSGNLWLWSRFPLKTAAAHTIATRHAWQMRQPRSGPAAISDRPSEFRDKSTALMVASLATPRGSPGKGRTTTRDNPGKREHKLAQAAIIRYLGCRPAAEAGPRS